MQIFTNLSLLFNRSIQKNLRFIFSSLTFSLFSLLTQAGDASKSSLPLVVISQIVQHVSLDQEREGLIAMLKEAGFEDGKTIKLMYENAQGNMTLANQIASNFGSLKPNVAIAISTPSAQTLRKPMADQGVPLIFTAVTDPIEAKLVTCIEPRPEDITGVSDALLVGPQVDLIQKLVPSVKTIGVIYNPGETNSVKAVQNLQDELTKRGLTLLLATADKTNEVISSATKLISRHVDAIYIPNDNTAVAAMESIVAISKKFKVPVFAGDTGSVDRGALAAQAYDRRALGRKSGALAVKILQGEKARDLAVETQHPIVLMVNLKSAHDMGITIPEDIKSHAKIIGDIP